MSLLVVESDPEADSSIADLLKQLGYESMSAPNLKTAAEMCDHARPELVICQRLDWANTLAAQYRYIPVALASRDTSQSVLLRALHAGVADVWEWPIEAEQLGELVGNVLQRNCSASQQTDRRLDQFVQDLERDQRAGRYIQLGMLPPNPMAIDRYRLHHKIAPSLILSGDFVDYFRVSERYFVFYVADVSGHGASSAFVTVLLKNFSRRLRREYRPSMLTNPGEILEWLNRELLDQKIDKHVAMFIAVGDLDEDVLRFANAGHFPPAILSSNGTARFLELAGKPIGLFDVVSYEIGTVELSVGDQLFIFSDGVLEVLPQDSLPEKEQSILDAVKVSDTVHTVWKALGLSMSESSEGPDDITCLSVLRES